MAEYGFQFLQVQLFKTICSARILKPPAIFCQGAKCILNLFNTKNNSADAITLPGSSFCIRGMASRNNSYDSQLQTLHQRHCSTFLAFLFSNKNNTAEFVMQGLNSARTSYLLSHLYKWHHSCSFHF